jgi:excisionase family DNA binding protein
MAHSATQSPRFKDLPELLTPKDLMEYLPLGRDAIYEALKSQTIRNVRVGQKFIIPKAALREFLGGGVE